MIFEQGVLLIIALAALYLAVRGFVAYRRMKEIESFTGELVSGDLGRRLYLKGDSGYSKIVSNLSVLASSLEETAGAAQELAKRLDTMLESIPDGIAVLDSKDRVRTLNGTFQKMFHVRGADLSGRTLPESMSVPQMGPLVLSARLEKTPKTDVIYMHPEDRYIEGLATPLLDAGERYTGAVIVFRDITAQKKIDIIRRDFVANVSHELQTPVTAIKGFTETLLDGALENREDAVKFLNTIKFQAERMERLIKDLIVLSKIEFGAVPLEKRKISLEKSVNEAVDVFREQASRKGLYIKKDIRDECVEIDADPERLFQILSNLLDNAIKYTEKGGVVVRARRIEGLECMLSVEDTGIGVPRKYLSRLGERFFRVDASRSRQLGGTGLGLAIVKHLILAQGWKMSIDSDVGKGTTVKLLIPET